MARFDRARIVQKRCINVIKFSAKDKGNEVFFAGLHYGWIASIPGLFNGVFNGLYRLLKTSGLSDFDDEGSRNGLSHFEINIVVQFNLNRISNTFQFLDSLNKLFPRKKIISFDLDWTV